MPYSKKLKIIFYTIEFIHEFIYFEYYGLIGLISIIVK